MANRQLLVVFMLVAPALVEAASAKPRLLVPAVTTEGEADPGVARVVGELLLEELDRAGRYAAVGSSDIDAMLSAEQQRTLAGCGDTACMVEILGALGAELVAVATFARIGESHLLSLKILNSKRGTVVGRSSEHLDLAGAALVEGVRKVVAGVSQASDAVEGGGIRLGPWWLLGASEVTLGARGTHLGGGASPLLGPTVGLAWRARAWRLGLDAAGLSLGGSLEEPTAELTLDVLALAGSLAYVVPLGERWSMPLGMSAGWSRWNFSAAAPAPLRGREGSFDVATLGLWSGVVVHLLESLHAALVLRGEALAPVTEIGLGARDPYDVGPRSFSAELRIAGVLGH